MSTAHTLRNLSTTKGLGTSARSALTRAANIVDSMPETKAYDAMAETGWSQANRLALELECLLLDCKDTAAVSKWWDSAHAALDEFKNVIEETRHA